MAGTLAAGLMWHKSAVATIAGSSDQRTNVSRFDHRRRGALV